MVFMWEMLISSQLHQLKTLVYGKTLDSPWVNRLHQPVVRVLCNSTNSEESANISQPMQLKLWFMHLSPATSFIAIVCTTECHSISSSSSSVSRMLQTGSWSSYQSSSTSQVLWWISIGYLYFTGSNTKSFS